MNVDWDEGEHLHPDERYMTMVTGAIRSPGPVEEPQNPPPGCETWGGYFDSYCSPLNPYNHQGYGSYAYGTLPLFGTRIIGEWLNGACINPQDPDAVPPAPLRWVAGLLFADAEGCVGNRFTDYGHVHLLGRMLSALVDLGTLLFIFLIGRRLYGPWVGLLAVTLYALAVLPIQQSHFYTVDAFAAFFITAASYFVVRAAQGGRWRDFAMAGLGFGLALACKVSVWPFAAIIAVAALLHYVYGHSQSPLSVPPTLAFRTGPASRGEDKLTNREEKPVSGEEAQLSPRRRGELEGGRHHILDWLMVLLLAIFCVLAATIVLFGIWSAVKITFYFAVALLLIGGAVFYIWRPGASRAVTSLDGALLRLLLAGLVAFVAFRATQPYAFVGTNFHTSQWEAPEYDWLRVNVPQIWHTLNDKLPDPLRALLLPDPRFISTLASVNKQLTGEADVPWGHQWTNRLPFLFPWINMVVWGMGLPLGLTVWAGWGLAAWELWRGKRRRQHFIPWAWATLLFFYQGTQWVKSIRYLLPIYPFLILLGAWFLTRLWRAASNKWQVASSKWQMASVPRLRAAVYRLSLTAVLIGTFLWAWGFTRIYTRPVTRNSASRWMVEHIPTAATLHYQTGGEDKNHSLRMSPTYTYTENLHPNIVSFVLPEDGVVRGITFTHLSDPDLDATSESFQVALSADPEGKNVLAQAERSIHLEQASGRLGDAQYFDLGPAPLRGAQEYYLTTRATAGAPVRLDTTVIANEYPDDSLPTRVDGRDPFGGMYRGLQSAGDGKTHWDLNEDTNKLAQALEWLDEADIISLSSNRNYASLPRLPSRYPMAIEFYRALFAGELGFELIATFTAYPTIGPFQFPDQETPFPPAEPSLIRDELGAISIYLPPAEEAFSVYDHPQVFLFRKTSEYSRQRAEAILGRVNLSQAVWMKPSEATLAPTALMLTAEESEAQREGGTWTDIFDADGWLNRWPLLGVLAWWTLVQALGLFAFPLLFLAAPGLRDRGWPLARTLGLLLPAILIWLLASGSLPYSRPLILVTLLVLAALGGTLAWWGRRELIAWARREWRTILVSELLFSGMFLLFLLIRCGNPDLWHPAMGGERPMDFAYLNAVIKSTHFPPYDPWFAGGYLNYYYFGFVIVGTPIKLLGLLPEIAYNLALPTFFALTGTGAYSVAYNLVGSRRSVNSEIRKPGNSATRIPNPEYPIPNNQSRIPHYALYAGLMAALFVAVLGNLSEIGLVADGLHELGSRDFAFHSTIPGLETLVVSLRGLARMVLGGEAMPWRPEWPYWNASRAIPHPVSEAPPITEFPFFTFLYSDLHAHLLALPLTLLALALAINWALDTDFWLLPGRASALRRRRRLSAVLSLVIGGLVIGSLRPANFWDYLTYLPLPLLTLTIGYVVHRVGLQDLRLNLAMVRNGVVAVGGRFVVLAALSYLFFLPYINRFTTAYTSIELWKGSKTPVWAYLVVHGLFLFPILTWLLLKSWVWLRTPGRLAQSLLAPIAATLLALGTLFAAVAGYQAALVVLPFGVLALLVLTGRETRPAERLVALMSGVGLAWTLLVEVIVQKGDISRMNTVFKFYLQVWVLFGISAAVCLVWIVRNTQGARRKAQGTAQAWRIWATVLALLIALAALYPILATRAKINDRWARQVGPGLDSLEWMTAVSDFQSGPGTPDGRSFLLLWDYQALMWLRENVDGSPVVAEGAQAKPYRSLRARVATYTGLPIIVGYPWHQHQQRSFLKVDLVGQRERDVDQLYSTPDPWSAKAVLDRYDVSYVYVGDLERITYDPGGIEKFEKMVEIGLLRPVYTNEGVTIYEVVR